MTGREHASIPVLTAMAGGVALQAQGGSLRYRYRDQEFVFPPSFLPAADLLRRLLDAGFQLDSQNAESWRLLAPNGLRFQLAADALASDLAVICLRFVDREYDLLEVDGALLIDVGANIADSAIYFVGQGARRVHAYEPFAATVDRARRNVEINGLQGQICLHRVGVGAREEEREVVYRPNVASELSLTRDRVERLGMGRNGHSGERIERVRVISLAQAVQLADPRNGERLVCKLDCEGAEFEIFEREADLDTILPRFDSMLIEYHYRSPEPITRRLQEVGFSVSVRHVQPGVGLLHATRA